MIVRLVAGIGNIRMTQRFLIRRNRQPNLLIFEYFLHVKISYRDSRLVSTGRRRTTQDEAQSSQTGAGANSSQEAIPGAWCICNVRKVFRFNHRYGF